jgi:hypothetical protein
MEVVSSPENHRKQVAARKKYLFTCRLALEGKEVSFKERI